MSRKSVLPDETLCSNIPDETLNQMLIPNTNLQYENQFVDANNLFFFLTHLNQMLPRLFQCHKLLSVFYFLEFASKQLFCTALGNAILLHKHTLVGLGGSIYTFMVNFCF